jgi:hypothetical protein
MDINLKLYVYFRDWEKVFDSTNWTHLMHILKETSIERHKIKLMSKHGSEC